MRQVRYFFLKKKQHQQHAHGMMQWFNTENVLASVDQNVIGNVEKMRGRVKVRDVDHLTAALGGLFAALRNLCDNAQALAAIGLGHTSWAQVDWEEIIACTEVIEAMACGPALSDTATGLHVITQRRVSIPCSTKSKKKQYIAIHPPLYASRSCPSPRKHHSHRGRTSHTRSWRIWTA